MEINYNSGFVKHAVKELELLHGKKLSELDGIDAWEVNNYLELLTTLSSQGHSGFSVIHTIDIFSRLASFDLLTPLQDDPKEWVDISSVSEDPKYQNARLTSVFKSTIDDKPFYINAVDLYCEDHKVKYAYIGDTNEAIGSSHYIRFPFMPKTFPIQCFERDGKHYVCNEHELNGVFSYYEKKVLSI